MKKSTGADIIAYIEKLKENNASTYDVEVIKEWLDPKDEVIFSKLNKGNFCAFIKIAPEDEHQKPIYQFIRFFMIGTLTMVSVDYDTSHSNATDPMVLLGKLLNVDFGEHNRRK